MSNKGPIISLVLAAILSGCSSPAGAGNGLLGPDKAAIFNGQGVSDSQRADYAHGYRLEESVAWRFQRNAFDYAD